MNKPISGFSLPLGSRANSLTSSARLLPTSPSSHHATLPSALGTTGLIFSVSLKFSMLPPTFHSLSTYIPNRASKEPCWWGPENPKQYLSLLEGFMLPQDPRQLVLEQLQGLLSLQKGQKAEASQY